MKPSNFIPTFTSIRYWFLWAPCRILYYKDQSFLEPLLGIPMYRRNFYPIKEKVRARARAAYTFLYIFQRARPLFPRNPRTIIDIVWLHDIIEPLNVEADLISKVFFLSFFTVVLRLYSGCVCLERRRSAQSDAATAACLIQLSPAQAHITVSVAWLRDPDVPVPQSSLFIFHAVYCFVFSSFGKRGSISSQDAGIPISTHTQPTQRGQ